MNLSKEEKDFLTLMLSIGKTMHEDNNDVTGEDYCSKGARRE